MDDDNGAAAMPLRVIDVEATIANRERGGIYFIRSRRWHVISHTWSADVRELSKIVGHQLKAAHAPEQIRSYEQLFEAADFGNSPSYQRFVDFLVVLRADIVKWVWFDAVCINQTDLEEKDREIQQMGTYYASCLGSYVVHHGIGKGFALLDDNMQLPRWFSRAWTFQEWVLPNRTTFIIDLASEKSLHKTAIAAILSSNSDSVICLCCKYEATFSPFFVRECMCSADGEASTGDNHDLVSSSTLRFPPLCRNRHFRRIPDRKDWYFMDDLGYLFLVRLKLQIKNAILWPGKHSKILQSHTLSDPEFQLTERLGVKLWFHGRSAHGVLGAQRIPLVVEEISVRDCSNEEDRVLSVLKLLGVEGAMQVRSGKSLNEQIVCLLRSLLEKGEDKYNQMVLQLCLADGYGNETPGMSWVPQLGVEKGSWQDGGRQLAERLVKGTYMDTFEAQARVEEVSMEGELRLASVAVYSGELICCEHDLQVAKDRSRADELVRPMALQMGGQIVFHLCARFSAKLVPDACVLEKTSSNSLEHGNSCILLRVPWFHQPFDHLPCTEPRFHNPLDYLRERVPVWLVKMKIGTNQKSYYVTYFLVCVGDNLQSPLHKIGYVGISSDFVTSSQFPGLQVTTPTVCRIGGLGVHSTVHLFKRRGTCLCCACLGCFSCD